MLLGFLGELLGRPLDQLAAASHEDVLSEEQALYRRRILRLSCSSADCSSPAVNHMLIFVTTEDDEAEHTHWADLCAAHSQRLHAWVDRHSLLLEHTRRSSPLGDPSHAELLRYLGTFLAMPVTDLPQVPEDATAASISARVQGENHACARRGCDSWAQSALMLGVLGTPQKWVDLCWPCHHDLRLWVSNARLS